MSTEGQAVEAGDLVWVDFDPRRGREQGGRRPALVISPLAFWEATKLAMVCPITSKVRPFGTSVVLPDGLPICGEILTSHVRSIDTIGRPVLPMNEKVPPDTLAEVRAKLAAITGSN